ncbi:MAG: transposase [Acidimicrobiaceae bacterium]|nr:transposase [Acidimicrobiaceae bacterium]
MTSKRTTSHPVEVFGGVDTHKHVHAVAAVDSAGRLLGAVSFPADPGGYKRLLDWLESLGVVQRVGVEGTGSYGAGLARYLTASGLEVVEVNRPNRQMRHRRGKTDPVDAEAAARAALNGDATAQPKSSNGYAEAIRTLTIAKRSAVKARTVTANQINAVVVTAPEPLRQRLRALGTPQQSGCAHGYARTPPVMWSAARPNGLCAV